MKLQNCGLIPGTYLTDCHVYMPRINKPTSNGLILVLFIELSGFIDTRL